MSALYITSYGKDLQKVMDEGHVKLYSARRGLLQPSKMSPYLRHLDRPSQQRLLRVPIRLLLLGLYWLLATAEAYQRVFYSVFHLFYGISGYLLTFWQIDMVFPPSKGPRESVYALSQPFPMAEVKTIQRAFSGSEPGSSQKGFLGHVTLNDVLCSVMADVVAQAIERTPKTGQWNRFKQAFRQLVPMPVTFFMYRRFPLMCLHLADVRADPSPSENLASGICAICRLADWHIFRPFLQKIPRLALYTGIYTSTSVVWTY